MEMERIKEKKHNIKHNSIVQDDDYILYTFFFFKFKDKFFTLSI